MHYTGPSSSKNIVQPNPKISTNMEFANHDSIPLRTKTPELPRELFVEIFNHLPGSKSLLRCRLVCRSWKEAVDSSPKLMRKLTVAVHHPSLFLDLNSFARRTRTIRLRQSLPSSKDDQNNFFTCIGQTFEKVVFDFMLRHNEFFNLAHAKNLVNEVFLRCEALNEIEIVESRFQLAYGLGKLRDEVLQLASAKVKAITIDWLPEQKDSQHKVLETLLLRFSNLCIIRFTSYRDEETLRLPMEAFRFIEKYMDKYPGILKRIYLPNSVRDDVFFSPVHYALVAENEEYLRLIFRATSQGIAINDRNLRCELDRIIKFEATQELKLDTPKYFSNFSAAKIFYYSYHVDPSPPAEGFYRLGLCIRIRDLYLGISVSHNPAYNGTDLQFLNCLHGIERLTIYSGSQVRIASVISVRNERILWNWASYTSSLKQLTILNHRFEALDEVEGIACTFPHLTGVKFEFIQGTDVNFLVALTKLDKLEEILLTSIEGLVDEAFTLPCEVVADSKPQGQVQSVPAIAAFKCLKRLGIKKCHLLTDTCMLEGISMARSLQSVQVFNCVGVTTVGFNALLGHMEETRNSSHLVRAFRRAIR